MSQIVHKKECIREREHELDRVHKREYKQEGEERERERERESVM